MESASVPAGGAPLETGVLASAVQAAVRSSTGESEPARAIDAAVGTLHGSVAGAMPSVFVLEHGRLWLVAQRGYAVVPDGIAIEQSIMGRAVRIGEAQLAADARSDPDYVQALPGVRSQLAVPLHSDRGVVGVLNVESERLLTEGALDALQPLVSALAPLVEALRASRKLDLSALARLFVYLGSLRDPGEIAPLAAASLSRVLNVEASQLWTWEDAGQLVELAFWRPDGSERPLLSAAEVEKTRVGVDTTAVVQRLMVRRTESPGTQDAVVWLPLRANDEELGALVAILRESAAVDPVELDTAAVLAAHVAASLDAAFALRRERRSAVTDSLTGILNRRGLEVRLEQEITAAHERRVPLSVLVFDCDDFKEINDRAGHEFGDSLLREVADVLASSLPESAECARLGGDEFVVMLPGSGAEVAEMLGRRIRSVLAKGLTEAGFPLRISAGIATYPFDGAGGTALLRAADQALYAAKEGGKDRIASFRQVLGREPLEAKTAVRPTGEERRRGIRAGASILADVIAAAKAIEEEETAEGVLNRLCKALVFIVGSTACLASRVAGGYLVDATEHTLREVWLGDEAAYRISDFPLTEEVLRTGESRAVSFLDEEVDPAEAFILRELNMNAMLMVPVQLRGLPWGLVELYEMRMRRYTEDDVSLAEFLVKQAERRLEAVGSFDPPPERPPVYELPPDSLPRGPRTR